jgi:hypothetical protein
MESVPHPQTFDRNGTPVTVGSIVRVLEVPVSLMEKLPPDEAAEIQSMKGAAFSVYEIDEWGSAWVEKLWNVGTSEPFSHSLALAPSEMEVIANASSDA